MHYDPYDCDQVWLRIAPDKQRRSEACWVTVPWTHRALVSAPFADFSWDAARAELARRGGDGRDQAAIAVLLDELLTRAGDGPPREEPARRTRRAIARGKAAPPEPRPPALTLVDNSAPTEVAEDEIETDEELAEVIPFGIFDAHKEAEKWPW